MKKSFILFILIFSNIIYSEVELKYNRDKAIAYASKYCSKYNKEEYKSWERDCSNFVSQCLIAGFATGKRAKGLYSCVKESAVIIGKDGITKGVINVGKHKEVLKNNLCFQEISDLSKIKKGDIISWKEGSHLAIYDHTNKEGKAVFYAHTTDSCAPEDRGIYFSKLVIYHFPDDDKCKKCMRNVQTCETELKDKEPPCKICDPKTGELKDKCKKAQGNNRCTPKETCRTYTVCSSLRSCETYGVCELGPGGDCPDDTETIGRVEKKDSLILPSKKSDIAILDNGYSYDMFELLSNFIVSAMMISPQDLNPDLEAKLLIIPTAGLFGLENSPLFKEVLSQYVFKGGRVLCLTQEFGKDFSVLPGGIRGYGWQEDQSCFSSSSFLENYHQILSGVQNAVPSINTDGYFTNIPENSIVLYRRYSNGMPNMILYPYGDGKVIVTTAFTDFAFSIGQASLDEINIIRDASLWLLSSDGFAEYHKGDVVTLNVQINNNNLENLATGANIFIYYPNGDKEKLVLRENLNLLPGESTTLTLNIETSFDDPLGIYRLEYELLTEGWEYIESEENPEGENVWVEKLLQISRQELSGFFVLSNPPTPPGYSPKFAFSVQSSKEQIFYGDSVTFTVKGWNNTDKDEIISCKYRLAHLGDTIQTTTMLIPAHGEASFNVEVPSVMHEGWLFAYFYDSTNNMVGYAKKGVWCVFPDIKANLNPEWLGYFKGQTAKINVDLINTLPIEYPCNLIFTIKNSSGEIVFQDAKDILFSPKALNHLIWEYIVPPDAKYGTYNIIISGKYKNFTIFAEWSYFYIEKSYIYAWVNIPSLIIPNSTNIFPIHLKNRGTVNVEFGDLKAEVKDPQGISMAFQEFNFALEPGKETIFELPVPFGELQTKKYSIILTQSDETKEGTPYEIKFYIVRFSQANMAFDKASYKAGNIANISVNLKYGGRSNQPTFVKLDVPDLNFSEERSAILQEGQSINFDFQVPIPNNISPGSHSVQAEIRQSLGHSIISREIVIPEAKAVANISSNNINAGESINLILENIGGVPGTFDYIISLKDSNGLEIISDQQNSTIDPINPISIPYTIDPQASSGIYFLSVSLINTKNGERNEFKFPIKVSGVSASMVVETDKLIYNSKEPVIPSAKIINGSLPLDNSSLNLRFRKEGKGEIPFKKIVPKELQRIIYLTETIHETSDGKIAILYCTENFIDLLDSNGYNIRGFILPGKEPWSEMFCSNFRFVVSKDNLFYVSDSENDKIQVIDSEGNLLFE